jgi:hypothetical protein
VSSNGKYIKKIEYYSVTTVDQIHNEKAIDDPENVNDREYSLLLKGLSSSIGGPGKDSGALALSDDLHGTYLVCFGLRIPSSGIQFINST